MEDEIKIIYEKQRKRYRHENSEKGEKRLRENGKKEREELERPLKFKKKKRWYKDINPTRGTKKGERRKKWT